VAAIIMNERMESRPIPDSPWPLQHIDNQQSTDCSVLHQVQQLQQSVSRRV